MAHVSTEKNCEWPSLKDFDASWLEIYTTLRLKAQLITALLQHSNALSVMLYWTELGMVNLINDYA